MKPQIINAIPIPFTSAGAVDWDTYQRTVEFLDPFIDAILVAGTTGEFLALDDEERLKLFQITRDCIGAERTIAHLGHASAYQAGRLAQQTLELGIERMALISPYYLPTDPAGVVEFYADVLQAAAGIKLFAYLFPERTGMEVSPETLAQVLALPGIAGVKLSGGSNDQFREHVAQLRPGQELYSGDDSKLPFVMENGGHGVVSGVSSVFPEVFADLAAAMQAGEPTEQLRADAEKVAGLVGPNIRFLKVGLAHRLGGEWASRMSMPTPSDPMIAEIHEAIAAHSK